MMGASIKMKWDLCMAAIGSREFAARSAMLDAAVGKVPTVCRGHGRPAVAVGRCSQLRG